MASYTENAVIDHASTKHVSKVLDQIQQTPPPFTIRAGSRIVPAALFREISLRHVNGGTTLTLTAHEKHRRALGCILDRDTILTVMAGTLTLFHARTDAPGFRVIDHPHERLIEINARGSVL